MVLHKWTLPLLLILLPGCSKSETKQMLTIHGHTFQAELIRTPSASRKFLSWNTLSRDSAFVVRFTPPRHHFYDSHQNKFEILFLHISLE